MEPAMEFILDFQGFKNQNNEFIIKELAIISTDEQVYELQLFQPPYDLSKLPESVQKQVMWLEKYHHGLFWGTGFKEYNKLKDVFKGVNISGKVYVKGTEKEKFVTELLSEFKVKVINLEDLGCPSLNILRHQTQSSVMRACVFNHSPINCAYMNVHILLQWLKLEKLVEDRLRTVDLAIGECYRRGYKDLQTELVKYLPKQFIINHKEDIELIYDRLPDHLKTDFDILKNMRCTSHFNFTNSQNVTFDGPNPKRKNCIYCNSPPPVSKVRSQRSKSCDF